MAYGPAGDCHGVIVRIAIAEVFNDAPPGDTVDVWLGPAYDTLRAP